MDLFHEKSVHLGYSLSKKHKQTDKQTNKQTNRQTNKPASKQASKQTDEHTKTSKLLRFFWLGSSKLMNSSRFQQKSTIQSVKLRSRQETKTFTILSELPSIIFIRSICCPHPSSTILTTGQRGIFRYGPAWLTSKR